MSKSSASSMFNSAVSLNSTTEQFLSDAAKGFATMALSVDHMVSTLERLSLSRTAPQTEGPVGTGHGSEIFPALPSMEAVRMVKDYVNIIDKALAAVEEVSSKAQLFATHAQPSSKDELREKNTQLRCRIADIEGKIKAFNAAAGHIQGSVSSDIISTDGKPLTYTVSTLGEDEELNNPSQVETKKGDGNTKHSIARYTGKWVVDPLNHVDFPDHYDWLLAVQIVVKKISEDPRNYYVTWVDGERQVEHWSVKRLSARKDEASAHLLFTVFWIQRLRAEAATEGDILECYGHKTLLYTSVLPEMRKPLPWQRYTEILERVKEGLSKQNDMKIKTKIRLAHALAKMDIWPTGVEE